MRLRKLLLVAVLVGGCQLISGVDDLEVTEAGTAAECATKEFPDSDCGNYCRQMCESCYGEQYPTDEACLAICNGGGFTGTGANENSIECHGQQAVAGHCLAAGPSGEAATEAQVCGTRCDNFCAVQQVVCGFKMNAPTDYSVYNDYDDCTNTCSGYYPAPPFNANGPDADTFECRFKYLLIAAGKSGDDLGKGNACAATGPGSIPCD